MTDWKKYKLGEIIDDIAMGPFGSNIKVDNFIPFGVPVIRGQNLNEGEFENYNKFVFISEEKAQTLKRCLAYVDDLVFTHRGTIGQVGIIPKTKFEKYLVSQSQLRLTVNKKYLSAKYLYYFFKSRIGQYELLKNASQVGVPAIATPTKSLKEIDVCIPDVITQKKFAQILTSLDDKIELNRQTNQTLEQIAQTLFKEWFVNFNYPGATGEMQESELGMIPKGWRVGNVLDLFELQRGFDLPSTKRTNGIFPVIAASGFNGFHNEYKIKAPGITTGRSGVIGNVFYVQHDFWPLNTSLFIKNFKIATPLYSFYVLKQIDLKQLNAGSAVPTLNRNDVHKISVIIPQKETIDNFENIVVGLFKLIQENEIQTHTLTQIRDTLLPRLMSGELEV